MNKRINFYYVITTLIAISVIMIFIISYTHSGEVEIVELNHKESPKLELKFLWNWGDKNVKSLTLMELLSNFEKKHPEIEIKSETRSGEDFYSKLQIDFASNDCPDILSMSPGYKLDKLIQHGKIADLTEIIYENIPQLFFAMDGISLEQIQYNDKIYGLPLEKCYVSLFINTDLMRICGLNYDFTSMDQQTVLKIEDLEYIINQLKSNDIIPIACSISSESSLLYQYIIGRLAGKNTIDHCIKSNFLSGEYTSALEYMKILYKLGAFPDNCFEISEKEANELFLNKKAAMIVQDTNFSGEVNYWNMENGRYNLQSQSIAVLPLFSINNMRSNQRTYLHGIGEATFYASAEAFEDINKKEIISKLFTYLADRKNLTLMVDNAKIIPIYPVSYAENNQISLFTKCNLMVLNAQEFIRYPKNAIDEVLWGNYVKNQLFDVLMDKKQPQEVIDEANAEIAKLLLEEKGGH